MRHLDYEQDDLGELRARSGKYLVSAARCLRLLLVSVSVLAAPLRGMAAEPALPVRYEIDLRQPAGHLVRVRMRIPDAPPSLQIQFPAWDALYQIRDFVRHVQDLEATCDERPADLRPVDVDTWQTGPQSCHELDVRYAVFANQESVFSAILDGQHAFLNLAQILFYLPAERNCAVQVRLVVPEGWKLATPLEPADTSSGYAAANYDELVDSPMEAGAFDEYSYQQKGADYRLVVYAPSGSYSSKKLLEVVTKITAVETALMGDVPFRRYTFIFHFVPGDGGGMEHANGAAIAYPPAELGSDWEGLESLIAHEFFHLWNVKRIRPGGFEPVDYLHGNDTRDLWFSEGVTSLYAELALVRSGLIGRKEFYQHLADQIDGLQGRPARRVQSAELAGIDAWLEGYPDYLRPERSISYYNKGELIGVLLDLAMRQASHSRASLDDLLRALNVEFAERRRFFEDRDLIALITRLTAGSLDPEGFFHSYVTGVDELDYQKYLRYAGLSVSRETVEVPAWGFKAASTAGGVIQVESVEFGSAAGKAGLLPGDILDRVNRQPLTVPPEDLSGVKAGERVQFEVERDSRKLTLKFRLDGRAETRYRVEEGRRATPAEARLRDKWLEPMAQ
jgi:predicted metalloprotease with PDZ domain